MQCRMFVLFIVAFRMYRYSVFAATVVGEGPPLDGTFITREDSELTVYHCVVSYWTMV